MPSRAALGSWMESCRGAAGIFGERSATKSSMYRHLVPKAPMSTLVKRCGTYAGIFCSDEQGRAHAPQIRRLETKGASLISGGDFCRIAGLYGTFWLRWRDHDAGAERRWMATAERDIPVSLMEGYHFPYFLRLSSQRSICVCKTLSRMF